ncbi:DNA/RNA non-specific endonuclease [Guptibacillus sedimenti]|uniref:DNA/RNA non-specific endonuclease n=1 Tax=Guptibacillus sedimenti TaxID=3025680 RepID=UPI00236284C3|nr:DNA/RNA non-specific endonuclease [Pseudalkalibacillus sedimenti]
MTDTNAYITPLAKQSMMQVDRNDIWVNLQQIERGISGNVGKASRVASRVPYNTFSFFDDPTESEIEKSRSNEANLNHIRREINRSESVLQQKMDDLWGIYNTKVKPFENTDDDYYGKAQKLKMSYTGLFEGVWDGVEDLSSDIYGFGKGLVLGLYEIGKGIVTVAGDAGIVYTSHQLPDSVEPDFLKEAADKRVEGYRAAAMQAIKDPMGVVESISQSFSDTYEDEGVAYVAGNVSTAFIPYVGMAGKSASLAKVAGKIPNSNLSKVAGSSKVDVAAIVKKHNAFKGIKRGMGEFVQDVKGGMQVAGNPNRVAFGANGIAENSLGRVGDVAESGVAWVSRSSGPNRAVDDTVVRIKTEVERIDGGKGTEKQIGNVSSGVIRENKHLNKNGQLLPNVKYKTGEYDYYYNTDDLGRIEEFNTEELKLTNRENRLPHKSDTPGKMPGDHAGHIAADRFGGSPNLDNLVSQSSNVNLSKYKTLENKWATAIQEGKKVSVNVKINYENDGLRPISFEIKYVIDGSIKKVKLSNSR